MLNWCILHDCVCYTSVSEQNAVVCIMSLFTALWRYLGCQPCYINYCYSEFKAWCETVCLPPDNGCSLPCGQPKPVVSKHFWFLVRRHYNDNNNRIQRRYSRFFTISSQRRELSPTRTLKWPRRNHVQITCNTSSAYHVQHVVLRATWYEGTAQLLSLTVEIAFIWALFCWLNH